MTTPQGQYPVDRKRRSNITTMVVGFCLLSSAGIVVFSGFGFLSEIALTLAHTYVTGCLSLATATTMAYITGSVVDYNGGIAGLFTREAPSSPLPPAPQARG